MPMNDEQVRQDRFGNPIDPTVGYARGRILASSVEERERLVQGQRVATRRLARQGKESIGIFTGNQRAFPVKARWMPVVCEEWLGSGLIDDDFQRAALRHLGGRSPEHAAALCNRTSGGLIAAIGALCAGKPVVSAVPAGSKSHASVARGCFAARVDLRECDGVPALRELLARHAPSLVLITTVSSNLDRLPENTIAEMIVITRQAGATVLVDDAYGARIRPILHGGEHALRLDADLVITNCDKAGMIGPRAGLLAGKSALIARVAAKAAEFGMEARAPIIAAVQESLASFDPVWLREEADLGQQLAALFKQRFGAKRVRDSDLGPIILEDDLMDMAIQRTPGGAVRTLLVPAEASSALGMLLLRDDGILTTNTHGQPGAKVSLRLRPTPHGLARVGELSVVVDAVDRSLDGLAPLLTDISAVAQLVIGRNIGRDIQ